MECADAATYYLLPNAYYLLLPTTDYLLHLGMPTEATSPRGSCGRPRAASTSPPNPSPNPRPSPNPNPRPSPCPNPDPDQASTSPRSACSGGWRSSAARCSTCTRTPHGPRTPDTQTRRQADRQAGSQAAVLLTRVGPPRLGQAPRAPPGPQDAERLPHRGGAPRPHSNPKPNVFLTAAVCMTRTPTLTPTLTLP